jgi:hypothetical protein
MTAVDDMFYRCPINLACRAFKVPPPSLSWSCVSISLRNAAWLLPHTLDRLLVPALRYLS